MQGAEVRGPGRVHIFVEAPGQSAGDRSLPDDIACLPNAGPRLPLCLRLAVRLDAGMLRPALYNTPEATAGPIAALVCAHSALQKSALQN